MKNFIKNFSDFKGTSDYLAENVKLTFANEISSLMDAQEITQAELAKRLGVTRGHVSRVLSASENLTIESMAKFFHALGSGYTVLAIDKRTNPAQYNEIERGLRMMKNINLPVTPKWQRSTNNIDMIAHRQNINIHYIKATQEEEILCN